MKIDDTKNKILEVAEKLFSRFGFHKTSMDEIAKIARKAKGSLYYHFASKEELFREVVAKEIHNLQSNLSVIISNNELKAAEKIKLYLIKRMEILNNAVSYHETIRADFFEHFDFIDDLRFGLDNWEKNNIKKIIQHGIDKGEFIIIDDIDVLIDMFIMVLKGLEIPFFLQNKYEKYSPYFDDLSGILIKGLSK
ncbi:MAG: TetR/AcrR family transcriptional regulator [Bacteroidales bacterium]|nr:TetR/AcrR family transcriptional regulator [Bacteroidales bacterium]